MNWEGMEGSSKTLVSCKDRRKMGCVVCRQRLQQTVNTQSLSRKSDCVIRGSVTPPNIRSRLSSDREGGHSLVLVKFCSVDKVELAGGGVYSSWKGDVCSLEVTLSLHQLIK